MPSPMKLDHAVINVGYQMDQAKASFENLGFHLTERGYHSLGSINHLMMFGSDYAELIGLPEAARATGTARADIANAALGINGLVFKSANVDDTYAHLQALGMSGDPPKSFSRPVDLADGSKDACFRTVAVRNGVFPGGRVYFCEHLTPELVWRPEWQSHANGVLSIAEFVVATSEHEQQAEQFSRLLDSPARNDRETHTVDFAGGEITIVSPAAYRERYGSLASCMSERESIFAALVLRTDKLSNIRDIVARMPARALTIDEAARVVLRETAFDCVLEFIQ
jgi:hypothetical protein